MSLSGREIFLVLRARDEASRTLNRVSRAMSKMDMDATAASHEVIRGHQNNLVSLQRRLGEVNAAYSNTAASARKLYQTRMDQVSNSMIELRRRTDDVHRAYQFTTLEAQRLHQAGKISADSYQKQMLDARRLRTQHLQDIQRERYIIEDAQHGIQREYHKTMQDARNLHLQQKDAIRSEMIASRDAITLNKERIRNIQQQHMAAKEAGHAMMRNGASALYMGTALITIGAIGAYVYGLMVKGSMEYTQAAATTLTQVDNVKIGLEDIKRIGLEVAKEVPVAFEQIQPALYDIFSSIDVNAKQARTLLKQFAQDAVAGQTDMEVATRANIAIMNAYKIKTKDAAQVSDFMFRLVQKGVGTYKQFASVIGRAIPSAKRAGQSYQTLGAMMAFLTRNGLSAAMAATSSARALDAISNPATVKRLEALGIKVKNLHGEFKSLPEILQQMDNKFGKLTGPERAKQLQELFKGAGGTIQAKRFFDTYFKNSKEFNKRVKEMSNTAGIAKEKFLEMSQTPQAKFQKLINKFIALRNEIGDYVMPVVLALTDGVSVLLDLFDKLPKRIKQAVAIFGIIVTLFTIVAGIAVALSGAIMMVGGAAAVLGIGAGALIGIFVGIFAVFTVLAGIAYVVYKNWNKIGPKLQAFWDAIKSRAEEVQIWFVDKFGKAMSGIWDSILYVWNNAKEQLFKFWELIKEQFKNNKELQDAWNELKAAGNELKASMSELFQVFKGHQKDIILMAKVIGIVLVSAIIGFVKAWSVIAPVVIAVVSSIIDAIASMAHIIVTIITSVVNTVTSLFTLLYNLVTGKWSALWVNVNTVLYNALSAIMGVLNLFYITLIAPIKTFIIGVIKLFEHLYDVLVGHSIVPDLVRAIISWFNKLPGSIAGIINKLISVVINYFKNLLGNVVEKVAIIVFAIREKFATLPEAIKNAINNVITIVRKVFNTVKESISNILGNIVSIAYSKGAQIVTNLVKGLKSVLGKVKSIANEIAQAVADRIPGSPVKEGPLKVLNEGYAGKKIAEMIADGMRAGIPLIKSASDALALAAVASDTYKGSKAKQRKQGLKDALDLRKQLLDQQKQYSQSVRDNIKSYGSLGSLETPTDLFGNVMPTTVGTIISGLQQKLTTIKQFGANLQKMKEMGYSSAIIDQVAQMGPEAGAQIAAALIAAMPSDVSQINSMVGEIASNAAQIGAFAADSMYGAGVATVEGLIAGLQSKDKKIRDAAIKIAKEIIDAIKSELGIASPSKVAQFLGSNFGSSMADAIASEEMAIRRAARILTNAAQEEINTDPFKTPLSGFTNTTRPQSDIPVTQIDQKITIHTNEIDPRAHAAELGFALAERFRL